MTEGLNRIICQAIIQVLNDVKDKRPISFDGLEEAIFGSHTMPREICELLEPFLIPHKSAILMPATFDKQVSDLEGYMNASRPEGMSKQDYERSRVEVAKQVMDINIELWQDIKKNLN